MTAEEKKSQQLGECKTSRASLTQAAAGAAAAGGEAVLASMQTKQSGGLLTARTLFYLTNSSQLSSLCLVVWHTSQFYPESRIGNEVGNLS